MRGAGRNEDDIAFVQRVTLGAFEPGASHFPVSLFMTIDNGATGQFHSFALQHNEVIAPEARNVRPTAAVPRSEHGVLVWKPRQRSSSTAVCGCGLGQQRIRLLIEISRSPALHRRCVRRRSGALPTSSPHEKKDSHNEYETSYSGLAHENPFGWQWRSG